MSIRALPRPGALALAVALLGAPAAGSVNVPLDFATIQAAIDSGATLIEVEPGVYHEAIVLGGGILRARHGPAFTIIDGGGALATVTIGYAQGVDFHGFTITGGVDGVVIHGGSLASSPMTNCVITGNSQYGCVIDSTFAARLSECTFLDNGAGGARLDLSHSFFPLTALIDSCTFRNDDLLLQFSGPPGFADLQRCGFDAGSVVAIGGTVQANTCIFRNVAQPISPPGSSAIYSDIEGGWPGLGNIDADPLWVDPAAGDYSLLPGSPCIGAGDPSLVSYGYQGSMGPLEYLNPASLGGSTQDVFLTKILLSATGTVQQGTTVEFRIIAPASGLSNFTFFLVLGGSALAQPAKGGVFWPHPDVLLGPFTVSGTWALPFYSGTVPLGLPAYAPFWAQAWWPDPSVPPGWSATNGLKGITWP